MALLRWSAGWILCLFTCIPYASCSIVPQAEPHSSSPAQLFSATAGSQPISLHPFLGGSFGIFPIQKPASVHIRIRFDVRWVVVRPLSAGITATIDPDHHGVRFTATKTTPLTIEFNDELSHVVHLFPYSVAKHPPQPHSSNVLYFGPGVHDAGQINLASGQTLYLAAGSWVKGSIRSVGTDNIVIRGHGVLDATNLPEGSGSTGQHNPIYLHNTHGAHIEGITIFNSSTWTVYLNHAPDTVINGLKVLNPGAGYGDDGMDIVSSSNVLVENSFVRTNDDCIVVKNLDNLNTHNITIRHSVLWNMPNGGNALEIGFETRREKIHNIRFEDLDLIHVQHGAAISIHDADAATVENVTYNNIRVEDAHLKLIDFSIVYSRWSTDRPKSEKEISQRMDQGEAWDGVLSYTPAEAPGLARNRGHIRNILIKNLHIVGGALPYSTLVGFDAHHAVENVTIEGLTYQGRKIQSPAEGRFSMQFTRGVNFK